MQAVKSLYRRFHRGCRRAVEKMGLVVYPSADFYSPLPPLAELERHRDHWDRPSRMTGVAYDLDRIGGLWSELVAEFGEEYAALPSYEDNKREGFGPGFTLFDAMALYFMLRHLKPPRLIEVGSGLSSFYARLALQKNAAEGAPCEHRVVDPFPTEKLQALPEVDVTAKPAQEVPLDFFTSLEAGDVLFIDTTHIVKVGGEVPYLYLEIVPNLVPGVTIHAHDIHFPYNGPYPAQQYVFNSKWPQLWTEPMLIQAFLAFNPDFEIVLSLPLLRHAREDFLAEVTPGYRPVEVGDYDTHFGSLWFRRVR